LAIVNDDDDDDNDDDGYDDKYSGNIFTFYSYFSILFYMHLGFLRLFIVTHEIGI